MSDRVLVAGIGNIFLGDDGFGPEVVRRLAEADELPPDVAVIDYGIRGLHLAYDLLEGYRALVLVDALAVPGPAGQVIVLDVGSDSADSVLPTGFDPHGMAPVAVLAEVRRLGGTVPATYVVGCGPETVGEGIGLSDTVAAAVPTAMDAVRTLLRERVAS
ncbi:hydrogenase maturation protease [Jatrophihabitans telluris]|uniref:Hydrogenase maturation protease n=1 Tax=Jatrophihabitans telluris TaxID=2038343 RepID=A0ABY4R1U0_9ACTN|nr:hydrogenase maturation protease [Jatrophihabitans telluris]UQX89477.1 hydrogenase maturation protease [Jatrophihabitans telluris]